LKQIGGYARQLDLPAGYSFRFGGQSKLLDETTTNMVLALALASVFIYIVPRDAVRELRAAARDHDRCCRCRCRSRC
jgi:multidrug efflux pump subunit AcrB